jgi:hypothetical protein
LAIAQRPLFVRRDAAAAAGLLAGAANNIVDVGETDELGARGNPEFHENVPEVIGDVRGLMNSCAATDLFVAPTAARRTIRISCGEAHDRGGPRCRDRAAGPPDRARRDGARPRPDPFTDELKRRPSIAVLQ